MKYYLPQTKFIKPNYNWSINLNNNELNRLDQEYPGRIKRNLQRFNS